MKTTRALRLPKGDDYTAQRVAFALQTVVPVDKSHEEECLNHLIWQRLDPSRAGMCDEGIRSLCVASKIISAVACHSAELFKGDVWGSASLGLSSEAFHFSLDNQTRQFIGLPIEKVFDICNSLSAYVRNKGGN